MEKVFIVFNTACIGDMLVTNALIQNIKHYYPESKVVFVCDKPYVEVAKYQQGVDEVVVFDKKKDKSLAGMVKFALKFPYKRPFASFVTYSNERNLLISRLLGAKHILSNHSCKLWNTKEKFTSGEYTHMKEKWASLIKCLTGEFKTFPIRYNTPLVDNLLIQKIKGLKNPVTICTTSNFAPKDMKPEDCAKLIGLLNQNGFTPILTGAGGVSRKFSTDLRRLGCFEYVDLIDCTSFVELANIMKLCGKCISVDTGTLHFANALEIPVLSIFYDGHADMWAPDENLYRAKTLEGYHTPEEVFKAFMELIK